MTATPNWQPLSRLPLFTTMIDEAADPKTQAEIERLLGLLPELETTARAIIDAARTIRTGTGPDVVVGEGVSGCIDGGRNASTGPGNGDR